MADTRSDARQHECGGRYELVTEPVTVTIRGTEITAGQTRYRCDRCGEERLSAAQSDAWEESVYALYEAHPRRRLLPGEVRAIRERLGLTQPQLEAALGLGGKTVVRWENGRVLQNQATDDLLRLVDRDPSALRFLASLHGAEVPSRSLSGPPGDESSSEGLRIPESLKARLERMAAAEGVDVQTYCVMVLADHAGRAEMGARAREAIQQELSGLTRFVRQSWASPPKKSA